MKALEKDRTRRYDTPNGLARDVQRYLSGEAVEACPPTVGYRLRKFYRRNRAVVRVGGGVRGPGDGGGGGRARVLAWRASRGRSGHHGPAGPGGRGRKSDGHRARPRH